MKKVICSTPSPATKPSEKPEQLLARGNGVAADYPAAEASVLGVAYPPGEDPDTLAAFQRAGFKIEVRGGGLTGHLKN